jgi:[ribosomal protein S5]-alanine N-acetyltransferase
MEIAFSHLLSTPGRDVLMRYANDLTFKLITPEDAAELLVFETQEREWFEQYIEARPEHF